MTNSNRIAKNVLVMLATQLTTWGLSFAVTLFLPRYAGTRGLGTIAIASSFVAIFDVVAPLGTSTVLVKEIARDTRRTGELLKTALELRLAVAALLAAAAIGLSHWSLLRFDPLARQIILVLALCMIANTTCDALVSALQGQQKMARQGVATVIDRTLGTGLTIVLILLRAPLPWIMATGLLSSTVSIGMNLSALLPYLQGRKEAPVDLSPRSSHRELALAGLPFMGWTVFRTLYATTDPLVLGMVAGTIAAGWYSAAFRLIGSALFFPTAICSALLPSLSALHGSGEREEFANLARRMLSITVLVGFPLAVIFICMPHQLLALLRYPPGFDGSGPVLRVAGVAVALYFIASSIGTTVIASDGQSKMLRASIVGTAVGIPACFALSYMGRRYGGNAAVGAMASDVLLEVMLIGIYLRNVPAGVVNSQAVWQILRCAVATAPMALLLLSGVAARFGLLVVLPAVLLYAAGALLTGAMNVREVLGVLKSLRPAARQPVAAEVAMVTE